MCQLAVSQYYMRPIALPHSCHYGLTFTFWAGGKWQRFHVSTFVTSEGDELWWETGPDGGSWDDRDGWGGRSREALNSRGNVSHNSLSSLSHDNIWPEWRDKSRSRHHSLHLLQFSHIEHQWMLDSTSPPSSLRIRGTCRSCCYGGLAVCVLLLLLAINIGFALITWTLGLKAARNQACGQYANNKIGLTLNFVWATRCCLLVRADLLVYTGAWIWFMAAIRVYICQMTFGYDGISQPVSSPCPSGLVPSALSLRHGAAEMTHLRWEVFLYLSPVHMYHTKLWYVPVCKCNANIISYPAVIPSPERGKVIMTKLVYKS